MYNCSISIHSKALRRKVRELAEIKNKELGLVKGSKEWQKMFIQTRRELLKKTAEIEQHYNYIAPNLRQVYCKPYLGSKGLYDIKYILEKEESNQTVSIISDNNNIAPDIVLWCLYKRNKLIINSTKSERIVKSNLNELKRIRYIFQQPFFVLGKIYFADFYFPEYKTIIEVDGGYHEVLEQKQKDEKRTVFLGSAEMKVIRMTNEEAEDSSCIYETMYGITNKHFEKCKSVSKSTKKDYQEKNCTLVDTEANDKFIDGLRSLVDLPQSKVKSIKKDRLKLISNPKKFEYDLFIMLASQDITAYSKMPFVISGDIYFVDIYLPDYNMIIELMDASHSEWTTYESFEQKIKVLESTGITILPINCNKLKVKIQ